MRARAATGGVYDPSSASPASRSAMGTPSAVSAPASGDAENGSRNNGSALAKVWRRLSLNWRVWLRKRISRSASLLVFVRVLTVANASGEIAEVKRLLCLRVGETCAEGCDEGLAGWRLARQPGLMGAPGVLLGVSSSPAVIAVACPA